jgi:hypothetical protein
LLSFLGQVGVNWWSVCAGAKGLGPMNSWKGKKEIAEYPKCFSIYVLGTGIV